MYLAELCNNFSDSTIVSISGYPDGTTLNGTIGGLGLKNTIRCEETKVVKWYCDTESRSLSIEL